MLEPGALIGFFSPSSPATAFAPDRTRRAIQYLTQQGYRVKAGHLTGNSDGYRAGSIKARADEINTLVRDPEVRVLMATIGGHNSNALLPYLDWETLAADPKIIVGYSDATALLLGIYARLGLVTFYGPTLVASFGEQPPLVDQTFASFQNMTVSSGETSLRYNMPPDWTDAYVPWETQHHAKPTQANRWHFDGSGVIEGRVIGGNLHTMAGIWGSIYMPEIQEGDILLIEDSQKTIAAVERHIAHLSLCGVLERIAALIIGKHERLDDQGSGKTTIDVVREVLDGRPLPIVDGMDVGHTHPMLTVPIGATLRIDFTRESVTLLPR
ncbi:S66 family peptidase [Larsenimonas rhizosphaerae]|uniref:S66 family peptidase n=1 Tax=Larsenimonas rhizosphaerae TaxID=2944682 RepID=UPI0020338EF6|nr:LD-carboxypeptidase [Larsenimonas rhizosphaerae]